MSNDSYAQFLATLREIGLVSHLNEREINTALKEARERGKPTSLFYSLPKSVYGFDAEMIYPGGAGESYTGLVRELSEISRGTFLPTNVYTTPSPEAETTLDWGDDWQLTLIFEFEGRVYSHDLERMDDWADPSFISTINRALADASKAERYYWINTEDQTMVVTFLTERQFQALRAAGLTEIYKWEASRSDSLEEYERKLRQYDD